MNSRPADATVSSRISEMSTEGQERLVCIAARQQDT